MDNSSYLIISNVVTGLVLIITCSIACCRRRIVPCPFCNERIDAHELRTHIGLCNQHNTLYMGRYSPNLQPLAVAVPVPPAAPLPESIAPIHPVIYSTQNFPKIVDI